MRRPLCGNLIQKKAHEIPLHFTDAQLHYTHSNALHFHFNLFGHFISSLFFLGNRLDDLH